MKKINKKAVFGLTAVQQFFAIILGIALLAYVIVIIMGTLSTSTIISKISGVAVTNESIIPLTTGTALSASSTYPNCIASVTQALNGSTVIGAGNYTVVACSLSNTTSTYVDRAWNVSYTYTYDSTAQLNSKSILGNTSSGITSFFSAINPVYAILAVLVIILVLVVLVRVVQSPNSQRPQI